VTTYISRPQIESTHIDLCNSPLCAAYIGACPPIGNYLHGYSIDLFFKERNFSIEAVLIENEKRYEDFALSFGETQGIDYWRDEVTSKRGMPVIRPIDLVGHWQEIGLRDLLVGPREVRLYASAEKEPSYVDQDRIIGLEMISKKFAAQRLLFAEADEIYTDVAVITPSDGYARILNRLRLLSVQ